MQGKSKKEEKQRVVSAVEYRELINKMLFKVKDQLFLKQVYTIVKRHIEKRGD